MEIRDVFLQITVYSTHTTKMVYMLLMLHNFITMTLKINSCKIQIVGINWESIIAVHLYNAIKRSIK